MCTKAPDSCLRKCSAAARLKKKLPDVPVVMLGESSDPKARIAAQSHGARAYVKKPSREDLNGPQGETHLGVFLISLENAMEKAISRAANQEAEARA